MRYLASVAVTAALILSGCLGGGAPDLEAANRELIDDARSTLGDDAELYAISGIEPSEPIPTEQTEGCGTIPADKNPGDGKASAWAYLYGSESADQGLAIVTDAKGDVLCKQEEGFWFDDTPPLDSWSVDSVEAARTIAQNVEDFDSRVDGAEVFMNLEQTEDGPMWSLGIYHMMNEDHAEWGVHAQTREFLGDLTQEIIIESPTPIVAPESGTSTGSTTGARISGFPYVSAEPATFTIEQEGHRTLEIIVESDDPLAEAGESYEVGLSRPDQEGVYEISTASNGETLTFDSVDPGEWRVMVYPVVAGQIEYTVDYCAYTDEPCEIPDPEEPPFRRLPVWS